jgi:hypothetical protein
MLVALGQVVGILADYLRWLGSAFTSTDSVECVDDQAAIQKAQQVVNGHDVELWERDRSIVRFSHDDQQIGQS